MAGITEWLSTLGLSEYSERFSAADIDLDALPELTGCRLPGSTPFEPGWSSSSSSTSTGAAP
jgi:hypothetical protein